MSWQNTSHKRYNILTGEWVLVSPHRNKRPWQGQQEEVQLVDLPAYDPDCYLCPGNMRANNNRNPQYEGVFVFDNDFPALLSAAEPEVYSNGLLKAQSEAGICRVVCYHPDHSLSMSGLSQPQIEAVISEWQAQYEELGDLDGINHVQIFENKGAVMGCSNPHPHGQIWAQESVPDEVLKKDQRQSQHWTARKESLLKNYLDQELSEASRVVFENSQMVCLVPFWAVWPYECMILPKRHQSDISRMTDSERADFAEALSVLTRAYDRLFQTSFPYSAGIHQAPTNGEDNAHWHWHMVFYPPLLRSATVKKFMVGYEMLGMPQRDILPEDACSQLRSLIKQ